MGGESPTRGVSLTMWRQRPLSLFPTDASPCRMDNSLWSRRDEQSEIAQDEPCSPRRVSSANGMRVVSVLANRLFKKSGESRDEG